MITSRSILRKCSQAASRDSNRWEALFSSIYECSSQCRHGEVVHDFNFYFLVLQKIGWQTVRQAWDSCLSCFFEPSPLKIKKIRVLRLDGNDASWLFYGNNPFNLYASWLKMYFLIIEAALAKICASSMQSRFFEASLSMFRIPRRPQTTSAYIITIINILEYYI